MREWGLMSHTAILWRFHSLLNSVAFLGCPDREGAGQGWQTGLESHLCLNLDHDTPLKKKKKGFINQIRFSRRLSFGGKEDPSAKIKWEKQWFSLYCLSYQERNLSPGVCDSSKAQLLSSWANTSPGSICPSVHIPSSGHTDISSPPLCFAASQGAKQFWLSLGIWKTNKQTNPKLKPREKPFHNYPPNVYTCHHTWKKPATGKKKCPDIQHLVFTLRAIKLESVYLLTSFSTPPWSSYSSPAVPAVPWK